MSELPVVELNDMKGTEEMLTNEIAQSEFFECAERCQNCDLLVTIKQAIFGKSDEGKTIVTDMIDVEQMTVKTATTVYMDSNPADGIPYHYVRLLSVDKTDLRRIYSLWETVLQRGTLMKQKGSVNDYILVFDLAHLNEEDGVMHYISYRNPVFLGMEERSLLLVVPFDNMQFNITTVDVVQIYDEVEYETETFRHTAEKDAISSSGDSFDENNDVLSNKDVLGYDDTNANTLDDDDEYLD